MGGSGSKITVKSTSSQIFEATTSRGEHSKVQVNDTYEADGKENGVLKMVNSKATKERDLFKEGCKTAVETLDKDRPKN